MRVSRPNILIVMVDQLSGTFFPDVRPGRLPARAAPESAGRPLVAIREGDRKYVRCTLDPEQLFNLAADARRDLARFDAEVRESQAQRRVVYEVLRKRAHTPWDHQPRRNAAERFMRNHMNLDTLEGSKRFPRGG